MIIFDVDHFKLINDRHGHLIGDYVLSEIAKLAQAACRSSDTVCRYGGEEFIVIAEDCDSSKALKLAERVRAAIAHNQFVIEGERTIHATASFGVSTIEVTTAQDLATLIKQADQALYAAKETGRNVVRVSSYTSALAADLIPEHVV